MAEGEQAPAGVDITRPSPARLYDYYLGGTNNFAVDRAAAEKMRELVPELFGMAWANRGFHQHAARWIAERGVRQFIDIGTADLREPDTLLGHAELPELIDFTQPVGLLMTAVLHFVSDGSDPRALVARYTGALAGPLAHPARGRGVLRRAGADRALPGRGPGDPPCRHVGAEDPAAADTDEGRVFYCGVARRL